MTDQPIELAPADVQPEVPKAFLLDERETEPNQRLREVEDALRDTYSLLAAVIRQNGGSISVSRKDLLEGGTVYREEDQLSSTIVFKVAP